MGLGDNSQERRVNLRVQVGWIERENKKDEDGGTQVTAEDFNERFRRKLGCKTNNPGQEVPPPTLKPGNLDLSKRRGWSSDQTSIYTREKEER